MISVSPTVYTVTELNSYVKAVFDNEPNLRHVFVTGEISNFKAHYTGHLYMTIKDEGASIKAVMFSSNASRLRFKPTDGLKVIISGSVSLYPKDGSYQLYITDMQPDGLGALNLAYEQLKKKLEGEGLFSDSRKKPIPRFPSKIGVITSPTGAAVRDIFNILSRRFPNARIVFKPVQVQGDGAAADIAKAINLFNEYNAADVLIVGRGGGSIEDLWAFNEEVTARAVAASKIPVISAVGHETDYTICDFTSDLRAPTPSAAAELAVPDSIQLRSELMSLKQHLFSLAKGRIDLEREKLTSLEKSALKNPRSVINDNRQELTLLSDKITSSVLKNIADNKSRLSVTAGKLNALSPLGVLARGYGIAYMDETPVTSVSHVKKGDSITFKLKDGTLNANITDVNGGVL